MVRSLGPDRASALSGALWRRLAPLNKRHARARAHLAKSLPGLSEAETARLLDEMWDNLGRTAAEAFHMAEIVADRARITLGEGVPAAIEAARRHGGVIVGPHQGNWELAAALFQSEGLPVAGVYQRLKNPLVDAHALAVREPFYGLGLHAKGPEAARELLRIVGKGGAVVMMADLRDLSGIAVPFFGEPAPSTVFPALLARGRGVPLFAAALQREGGVRFRLLIREIPVQKSKDRDEDLTVITAAIQAQFEAYIRERPGQWMWGHRRWRR